MRFHCMYDVDSSETMQADFTTFEVFQQFQTHLPLSAWWAGDLGTPDFGQDQDGTAGRPA